MTRVPPYFHISITVTSRRLLSKLRQEGVAKALLAPLQSFATYF